MERCETQVYARSISQSILTPAEGGCKEKRFLPLAASFDCVESEKVFSICFLCHCTWFSFSKLLKRITGRCIPDETKHRTSIVAVHLCSISEEKARQIQTILISKEK